MTTAEIIEKLLALRGVVSPEERERFFNPRLGDLCKAEELPGVVEAADVILNTRGKIVVFGDYDCDGVCATAILASTLKALKKTVAMFLPERLSEGYGMTDKSVERMLNENGDVELVVTVDNGINSVSQIATLEARGIKVVVTDHHLPGEELPEAEAIVNPKVKSPEKLDSLCGAGVAFFLSSRLVSEAKRRGLYSGGNIAGPLLVLAGLATVTDVMPLLGQNRILVTEALKRFHSLAPLGLKELLSRATKNVASELTARDFGFLLGPRINAAGRMSSGMEALELILSEEREAAREAARIVDTRNVERKQIEQSMTEEAMEKIVEGAAAQVIDLPNGHQGIAGIVAARVLERLGVPVCVVAGGHGSARSVEGVNIREAMEANKSSLERFGGHAAAGGFSVKEGMIDEFRRGLCEYCEKTLGKENIGKKVKRGEIELRSGKEITLELADAIRTLEPFGEGNAEPTFEMRGVYLADVRAMGAEGRHLTVDFKDSSVPRAVWWNHGDIVEDLRRKASEKVDVVFTLEISDYQARHVELRLIAIEPHFLV